jgi:hypothetical protein
MSEIVAICWNLPDDIVRTISFDLYPVDSPKAFDSVARTIQQPIDGWGIPGEVFKRGGTATRGYLALKTTVPAVTIRDAARAVLQNYRPVDNIDIGFFLTIANWDHTEEIWRTLYGVAGNLPQIDPPTSRF